MRQTFSAATDSSGIRKLALAALVLVTGAAAQAADEYVAALERLAPGQASVVTAQSSSEFTWGAAGASEVERVVIAQASAEADGPLPASCQENNTAAAWTLVLLLPGLLVATKILGYAWIGVVTVRDTFREDRLPNAQESALGGLGPVMSESGPSEIESPPSAPDRLQEFLEVSAGLVGALRKLVRSLDLATEAQDRQAILVELQRETTSLKAAADKANLQPVWQMAAALENLLSYLIEKQRDVTYSTFETVTAAADVLSQMCLPGLNPDITIDPPIRFLAVDDDEIGRHSVFLALKKVLRGPDLASDGPGALELVEANRYDVIFLDIEMPGMDGFEVCSRIRKTHLNCATPVVFVTYHADAKSRETVEKVGGQELVSKPFVISELSVRALTLVLQSRLRSPDNVLSLVCRADS